MATGAGGCAAAERSIAGSIQLGNRRCRLDARARNQHHRAFAPVDDALLAEPCEGRRDAGRGRLHKQAKPREPLQGYNDFVLGDGDRFAAGLLKALIISLSRKGCAMAVPSRDRFLNGTWHRRVDAGLEARIQRRTVERLGSKQPGQFADLSGGQQSGEANVAAEEVAAGTDRHDDIVGNSEIEILPQLIGDRFGSLQEEGLPVVVEQKTWLD